MKISCVYYDTEEKTLGQCTCPARQRKGPLVNLFGEAPACILIAAKTGTTCPDQRRLEDGHAPTSYHGQLWAKLGRMAQEEEDDAAGRS